MRCWLDTTIRIAATDAVTLEPTGVNAVWARLVSRFTEAVVDVVEGSLELPHFNAPDVVAIEWIGEDENPIGTTTVEVVSRHYFDLEALKSYGGGQDDFEELDDDVLFAARQAATEVFEQNARRSFVKRLGKKRIFGQWGLIQLENDVDKVETVGFKLVSDNQCVREPGTCEFETVVEFVYGLGNVPSQVSRAVLELAAYYLRPTNRPIGATGESTDAGFIHFTTAGRDGAMTDIPEVNAAIQQFGRREPLVW